MVEAPEEVGGTPEETKPAEIEGEKAPKQPEGEKPEGETPETPEGEAGEGESKVDKPEETPEGELEGTEGPEGPEGAEGGTKRTPRLMEVWRHKTAEKNWDKQKEAFEGKILDLTEQLEGSKDSPERKKMINEFAEKSGMESDVVEGFLKIAELPIGRLTKELSDLKKGILKGNEKNSLQFEDSEFEKDFDKTIVPVLEADGVSQENRPRLKKLLKTLAFSEKYAKVALPVIYRGVEDFQQFLEKGKPSGEAARGGIRGAEEKIDWLNLSPKDYDKRIEDMKKEEGKFDIRRGGRIIRE